MGDKSGREVTDKCKLVRPKAPRVGDKCRRQVWKTSVGEKCKLMRPKAPRVKDKWGDRCKLMRPKAPRSGRQVWETNGRQV